MKPKMRNPKITMGTKAIVKNTTTIITPLTAGTNPFIYLQLRLYPSLLTIIGTPDKPIQIKPRDINKS